jgi:hypothetical protein
MLHIHIADLDLAEQNQTVAAGYRQATNSTTTATAAPPLSNTFLDPLSNLFPDAFVRKKKMELQVKMMESLNQWKLSVQTQVSQVSPTLLISLYPNDAECYIDCK